MQVANVSPDQVVSDLGRCQVLLSEPAAERIGVAQLPANALTRIVSRLKFGGQGTQVGGHQTGAHPVQNMGCCEIGFDQVLLLPAQLAGRKTVSGLCRLAHSPNPRPHWFEIAPICFTRDYPELGISFPTPSTGFENMVSGEPNYA